MGDFGQPGVAHQVIVRKLDLVKDFVEITGPADTRAGFVTLASYAQCFRRLQQHLDTLVSLFSAPIKVSRSPSLAPAYFA